MPSSLRENDQDVARGSTTTNSNGNDISSTTTDGYHYSALEEKLALLESKVQHMEVLLTSTGPNTHNHDLERNHPPDEDETPERRRQRLLHEDFRNSYSTKMHSNGSPSALTLSTTRSDWSNSLDSFSDDIGSTDPIALGGNEYPRRKNDKTSRLSPSSKDSKNSLFSSIIEDDLNDEDDYKYLSQDTFSLMLLANAFTKQWMFGLGVFLLQIGLLSMIAMDQFSSSKDSSPFDVPYRVETIVHVGQLLAIFLSLTTQTDLVMAIMTFMLLWTERRSYWTKLIKVPEDASLWVWTTRIAFPICCELVEGACVLFTTFVIVIQSSTVIDLFKDFAAMQLISELDNMMFWLALHGYVGAELCRSAKQAVKIKIHDNLTKSYGGIPLRTLILLGICMAMIGSWGYFVYGQVSGRFFALKYPKCMISDDEILKLNNGVCDGGRLNTIACGFDDGDCITFNLGYPNCKVDEPRKIGNGICDQEYNDKDCLYDGDDCCPLNANDFPEHNLYADGKCHGGVFNTNRCNFDGGDCVMANSKYPECPVLILTNKMFTTLGTENTFPALGDGHCDGGVFNTQECGWDDGDCIICNSVVPDPSKIGDGHCDGGLYLETAACDYDGHDCTLFKRNYPDCDVPEPERLGNGHCDGNVYFTTSCGYDGGDCNLCHVTYPSWIGDGICDGNQYLTTGCSLDGGDCDACLAHGADAKLIGDGLCQLELNTTECGWDGHDCLLQAKLEPCRVDNHEWLGDGYCDGGIYNTEACGYDGGDCLECNSIVPDRRRIGDGVCDGGPYNYIEACNEDGGDCRTFNKNYPDCKVQFPGKVGDGKCDGSSYFTLDCKNDGGDCKNCVVEVNAWVGDGFCDGGQYLTSGCSMDGGDCDRCMQLKPGIDPNRIGNGICDLELNITECGFDGQDCALGALKCVVPAPELLGNGYCNGGDYNSAACNFDDGDCIDCNEIVPFPEKLGDGKCDGGIYMTTPSCVADGGDCISFLQKYPNCIVPDPEKVGDGICDGALYFKNECGWDGGDCSSCQAEHVEWIGDGICNGGKYLSPECNRDGGDCDLCLLSIGDNNAINLGDGYCDKDLNTVACGHDGLDCVGTELCHVPQKSWLGDSFCDGGIYNTEICGFDKGDCIKCNNLVPDPSKIGNGYCDGGLYMTLSDCNSDGQDCVQFLKLYPSCIVPLPELVGNGECDGVAYNTTDCGWDGGDCIIKNNNNNVDDDSVDDDDGGDDDDDDDDDDGD